MKNFSIISAVKYYLYSIPRLVTSFNFWVVIQLIYKSKVKITVKRNSSYYIRNLMDLWTLKEVIIDDVYKLGEWRDLEKVIDIGAALGDFSISASKISDEVFAFESDSSLVNLIKQNLKLNNVKNVTPVHLKVDSLDKLFDKYKIGKCDFLKIDCEGAEYPIFSNSSNDILDGINRISMEAHLFKPNHNILLKKLLDRFEGRGFKVIVEKNPVHNYLLYVYAQRD